MRWFPLVSDSMAASHGNLKLGYLDASSLWSGASGELGWWNLGPVRSSMCPFFQADMEKTRHHGEFTVITAFQ